jgi:outer membrane immunogenic protein
LLFPAKSSYAVDYRHKLEWFGTSRSRLGFLATPNILLYGTAGVAYGQVKDTFTVTGLTVATATVKDPAGIG